MPLLSTRRDPHHRTLEERFAADPPAPATENPVERMKHRLATQAGRALYALRKQTVEPVFGIIKQAMNWRGPCMRGLGHVQGEWSLMTMVWNIKRMHRLQAA